MNKTVEENIEQGLRSAISYCYNQSYEAGWWYDEAAKLNLVAVIASPQNPLEFLLGKALVAQKLCLSHSENSEAMEGFRKGLMDDKLPHHPMITVEICDCIIRLLDLAGALNLDVPTALIEKLEFNKTRPDHKPENRAKEGGKSF